MRRMFPRFALIALGAIGFGGAAASADAASITSQSASAGLTTATLSGVITNVNPASAQGAGVTWVFEYATDKEYKANLAADPTSDPYTSYSVGGVIPPTTTGPVTVTDVIPAEGGDPLIGGGTKYHYRLDVIDQTSNAKYYPYTFSNGPDATFLTATFGKLSQPPRVVGLSRKSHRVFIPIKCNSKFQPCKGKAGLTIHVKRTLITCFRTNFSIKPGRTLVLKQKVAPLCFKTLAAQKSKKIKASFTVRSTTGQGRIQKTITLKLTK